MPTENLMSAELFCTYHHVEPAFLYSLREYGLIEITTIEQSEYIEMEQLHYLERLVRLHYDLDINVAGIEAIAHLLEKVETMQQEIASLRNRLRLYEDNI